LRKGLPEARLLAGKILRSSVRSSFSAVSRPKNNGNRVADLKAAILPRDHVLTRFFVLGCHISSDILEMAY
jgi:hypothetical protein